MAKAQFIIASEYNETFAQDMTKYLKTHDIGKFSFESIVGIIPGGSAYSIGRISRTQVKEIEEIVDPYRLRTVYPLK